MDKYTQTLIDSANLGNIHRDMRNTIMIRDTFRELDMMKGLDYETVQDAYRAYRNAYNAPVKVASNAI